jgi:sulfur carrier protein
VQALLFQGCFFYWVSRMKSLKVNGVEKQFPPDRMPGTLSALLDAMGVGTDAVVAEVDGRIVRREEFPRTQLQDGQQIELIRLMGGG